MQNKVVVIFIHGTFARQAQWCNSENSPIRSALTTALGDRMAFRVFEWSGKNSHRARIKAGNELAKFHEQILVTFPKSKIFWIAHSHGGNVALYALNDILQDQPTGIVTLATPYIQCEPREIGNNKLQAALGLAFLTWIAVTTFTVILLAAVLQSLIGVSFIFSFQEKIFNLLTRHHIKTAVSVLALINGTLSALAILFNWSAISAILIKAQEKLHKKIATPRTRVPILAFHVEYDEAKGWLSLVSAVSEIPALCWLGPRMTAIIYFYSLWRGLKHVANTLSNQAIFNLHEVWEIVLHVIIMPVAFVGFVFGANLLAAVAIPYILRSHKLGFGGEGVLYNLLLKIGTSNRHFNKFDDLADRIVTAPASGFRVRHSWIYTSPDVADDVAKWVRHFERRRVQT
jgi:pimeloyl-ACP methyl ester carboxylesterase